ncbi:hypothetical protein ANN_11119 [Periplaneta americana]|uniref:Collagenase NC10/endostatin domain-containing protein n=1 Tax=Periplaneta americana TaxID=6978 RepID=A0ABQ8T447_PERAM|nr:hypothetical protein ANN_11119 [Periplaneta americana]
MASALTFLMRYHTDGDAFLDQIVTGDETWVSHNTPETKRQSRQWHQPSSPKKPKKFKQTLSTQKVMATVFWDRKGVLLLDFMPKGTTINANRYCETLRKLQRAIQNKRRGMLSRGVVLLHDNARPHTAASTRELLDQFGWEIFDHPPYSPDLAPSDFHLFTKLKDFLGGTRFGSDEELKKTVNTWLNELVAEEYNTEILKPFPTDSGPTRIVPGAVTFQNTEAMTKLGSLLPITTQPPPTTTPQSVKPPFEASNLINNKPAPVEGPSLRMAALNEPYTGDMTGVRGADYSCYRESRRAGLRGTFRAFLSSRVQNLDSIVRYTDRELPVVNIKGEVLFNSWKDMFNGDGGFFSQQPRIYSFSGKNILTDFACCYTLPNAVSPYVYHYNFWVIFLQVHLLNFVSKFISFNSRKTLNCITSFPADCTGEFQ